MADSETFDIDPALLREFLSESLEAIEGMDPLFVALESHPEDRTIVDQIFRPIHSIKGNSSFFGLTHIKNFSHAMENILQEIRSNKRKVTKPIIDTLLAGTDRLRAMMQRVADGDRSTAFHPEEESLLAAFNRVLQTEEDDMARTAAEIRNALRLLEGMALPSEAFERLGTLRQHLEVLLKRVAPASLADGAASGAMKRIFRIGEGDVTSEITTLSAFIPDVIRASQDEQRCEAFLAALRRLKDVATAAGRSTLLEALATLEGDFTTIHESGIGFDDLMAGLLKERLAAVMSSIEVVELPTSPVPSVSSSERKVPPTSTPPSPSSDDSERGEVREGGGKSGGKTLRIAEEKVDGFMSYVGELIIAGEVFAYIQKKLERYPDVREIAQEFKNANLAFNELSTNLQKSLMAVRRLPLKTVFQKLPRLVRDLTAQTGKEVKLTIEGEDVQIDKSLLEGLENPLVHMVRNSVDHGIEPPQERIAKGKPSSGHIWILAHADDETFRLTIRDDGRGLDVEAIKAKSIEKGIITAEKARTMSDAEAYRLIFAAGVSTAKKITDVSGRGVGMDVVLTSVEKLNGSIEIESTFGQGTTFHIVLPMTVTLMVIDGLVAAIGGNQYIIPLTDVRESVRPRQQQVFTVSGRGEMIDVRGELYRLVRLHDLLGVKSQIMDPCRGTVVLVANKGDTCGLLVDELLGQQSVVLKDLGKHFAKLRLIQGGAILGDGRVGLVLDTRGILDTIAV